MLENKLVPPDGGWGWVVSFAFALHSFFTLPIMQNFGLVYKDRFKELGLTATDITIIMNTNIAFGMIMGLVNGPLLRNFGYRKISLCGGALALTGIVLTSFADHFLQFFIFYGIINSLGIGMSLCAFQFAITSYFVKNRGKAMGLSLAISGIGQVLMPQVFTLLLQEYGVKGATLVIAGLGAHTFVSSMLLQPIKWHMKIELVEDNDLNQQATHTNMNFSVREETSITKPTKINELKKSKSIEDMYFQTKKIVPKLLKKESDSRSNSWPFIPSFLSWTTQLKENERMKLLKDVTTENSTRTESKPDSKTNWCFSIISCFDLLLLKDLAFLSLLFGMSMGIFAENNFNILTPFILGDYHLDTSQIALFTSVLSSADIVFRIVAPFIADLFKFSARTMYLLSLCLVVTSRFVFLLLTTYKELICISIALGIARGFTTVYMPLVVPSYVPIEKFPSALGLQLLANGLFFLCLGPVLGIIRDASESYRKCIYVLNYFSLVTIIMWTVESIFRKIKNFRQKLQSSNV